MRLGFLYSLSLVVVGGLSAGCTQDFGQFEPTGGSNGDCAAGQKLCDGACVATTDPAYGCGQNCGACATPNAVAVCENGACGVGQCNTGFTDCDGFPTTGCESDTTTDPANCGACGVPCAAANASTTCAGGICTFNGCDPGFLDCDGNMANGCEVSPAADPLHCGTCTTACNSFQTCQAGLCVLMCPAGTQDCDADPANGCETTIGTATDCGGCGDVCNLANSTSVCNQGACAIQMCNTGFDNCDGLTGNGCETNLNTTPTACGSCTTSCPAGANSNATCNNAICGISCIGTFRDCNGMPGDGCEVNISTSAGNCGGCFRACSTANATAATCTNGLCNATCTMGFGDCTHPAAPVADNGCETDTAQDVLNCGTCGRACSASNVASRSCSAGLCNSTCDLGWANCTMPTSAFADNGCELNVTISTTSCGGCGNACTGALDCDRPATGPAQKYCGCSGGNECGSGPGNESCTAATGLCSCDGVGCAIGELCIDGGALSVCSCNGGLGCDALAGEACCQSPAGCFNLQTSPASCGACGHGCAAGFACAGGLCRCDEDADCDAGTPGLFQCNVGSGICTCGVATCAVGERCLSTGQCG